VRVVRRRFRAGFIDRRVPDYVTKYKRDLNCYAMKDYVAKKKMDPSGVDTAALSAFESWITERAGVAEQTKLMAFDARHGSW
jgi:hypothetical protein